jgi:hypothetical protein
MRKLLLLLFVALACMKGKAQEKSNAGAPGQTSFYAEVGGPGILFSANIDHRFHPSSLGSGMRIGVGFVTTWEDSYDTSYNNYYSYTGKQYSVATFPIQFNYVFGKENSPHTFEVGVGATLLSRRIDAFNSYGGESTFIYETFSFMYRRQPKNGGFSWRIGFTPLLANGYIQPSGAASLGYNF